MQSCLLCIFCLWALVFISKLTVHIKVFDRSKYVSYFAFCYHCSSCCCCYLLLLLLLLHAHLFLFTNNILLLLYVVLSLSLSLPFFFPSSHPITVFFAAVCLLHLDIIWNLSFVLWIYWKCGRKSTTTVSIRSLHIVSPSLPVDLFRVWAKHANC